MFRKLRLSLALLLLALSIPYYLASAKPAHAVAQTIVTIQFDDGVADQYTARSLLAAHQMHATFYVNSGLIGDSAHMTWAQLHDLYADGNEIGGHTLTHANLKHLKTAVARQQ